MKAAPSQTFTWRAAGRLSDLKAWVMGFSSSCCRLPSWLQALNTSASFCHATKVALGRRSSPGNVKVLSTSCKESSTGLQVHHVQTRQKQSLTNTVWPDNDHNCSLYTSSQMILTCLMIFAWAVHISCALCTCILHAHWPRTSQQWTFVLSCKSICRLANMLQAMGVQTLSMGWPTGGSLVRKAAPNSSE